MPRRADLPFEWQSYGRSRRGASLDWLPPAGETCRLLLIAGVHGEEPETTVILSRALRCLELPPQEIACIPAINPDGFVQGTRGNAWGVDLNRNFPTSNWQAEPVNYRWHLEEDTAPDVAIQTGEHQGSEPETQAFIDLIERLVPDRVIAMHAPLGCVDDPDDSAAGRWLADSAALPLVTDIGYPTPGSMGTWARERGLPLITWEFPPDSIESLSRDVVPVLESILSGEALAAW